MIAASTSTWSAAKGETTMVFYGYASNADELRSCYLDQDYDVLTIEQMGDGSFQVTYFEEMI